MSTARTPTLWWITISSLLVLALGCGPDLGRPATVTGKVTVDGQPLDGSTVAFHCTGGLPAECRTVRAVTDSTGAYTITKVYPGSYSVTVIETATVSGGGALPQDPGMQKAFAEAGLRPTGGHELQVDVNAETVTFDIQLTRSKSKGRSR